LFAKELQDVSVSRRAFLKATTGLAGALGAGVVLDACGSSSSTKTTEATSGTAKRGGTLTAGYTGGSNVDTVDGFNVYTNIDYARTAAINEQLVQFEANGEIANRVAEEFISNSDGTQWTIRARDGLTFHNGKPLTADDIIFSFQHMLNPKAPTLGSAAMVAVDRHGLKKLDSRTVRLHMTTPQTTLREQMSAAFFPIVPVGYDPKKPMGLGPFKLESFDPGQRSTMSRFADYYLSPKPYFDNLIIQDFPTTTSQLNALTGGQINAAAGLPFISARELATSASVNLLNERSGQWLGYLMRCDKGPFADARVRQAFRLLVDRKQFASNVYNGQMILGNDIFARFDPNYNSSLPQRVQDVEKAKHLLKAAGMESYSFAMITGPYTAGLLEGAELIAQQAQAAGVKMTVQNQPVAQYIAQGYLKDPFAGAYWPSSRYAAQATINMTSTADQNETHWHDPEWDALWTKLNRTTDPAGYRDIVHQMQAIEWERGGYIIPGFSNSIDAAAKNVRGLGVQDTVGSFGGPHWELGWIS
jgi:peptide/nickel transport system substrate-binding protein